ncbi:MAG: TlpA family protein disulfide reductase [Gammaproteobacteria bacterium]|nr:TlpA family protein disulfide reductase [Gammaproteobacteria bacterium]
MKTIARIGQQAPELQLETWLQSEVGNIGNHLGKVILIEVFQVNCTGCFVHALPEAIRLHNLFAQDDFIVLGIATAFENFDINTEGNLKRLIETGEVVGEPLKQLANTDYVNDNKLDYILPFPIAMDKLVKNKDEITEEKILAFIESQISDYRDWPEDKRTPINQQALKYLKSKTHNALTFETYQLQGTPSSILIDKNGILRDISFGIQNHLEALIRELISE